MAALPSDGLTPETTSGREGFIHPYGLTGTPGEARLRAIVRDFDEERLREHVELFERTAREVVRAIPRRRGGDRRAPAVPQHALATSSAFPEIVAAAEQAIRAEGIEPVRTPIRGGTDGSRLSEMGLPTPNLFTGGHEYHSVREWASVHDMASAAATIVRLAEVWTQVGEVVSAG